MDRKAGSSGIFPTCLAWKALEVAFFCTLVASSVYGHWTVYLKVGDHHPSERATTSRATYTWMMPALTVAICTHNPRKDYLERTLSSLAAQDLDRQLWELLIIDNASNNEVCSSVDLSWHPSARLIREERLGLTPARLRAIEECQGALILFVDDDNVLQNDYLKVALDLADRYPVLGVFGSGRIEPEYEETPDPQLVEFVHMLALRTVQNPHWSNDPMDGIVPWGAGMVVQRAVAERYHAVIMADPLKQRLDRTGNTLNSCGDDEFSWVATEMGLGKGIFPELKVLHLINKSRSQRDYLLRLTEGHAFSRTFLRHLHGLKVSRPEAPPSLAITLWALLRLRISEGSYEAQRLVLAVRQSATARDFGSARRKGIERFFNTIHG